MPCVSSTFSGGKKEMKTNTKKSKNRSLSIPSGQNLWIVIGLGIALSLLAVVIVLKIGDPIGDAHAMVSSEPAVEGIDEECTEIVSERNVEECPEEGEESKVCFAKANWSVNRGKDADDAHRLPVAYERLTTRELIDEQKKVYVEDSYKGLQIIHDSRQNG